MQATHEKVKSSKESFAFIFMKAILSGIEAIGQGMEKQHDEQLTAKSKTGKEKS